MALDKSQREKPWGLTIIPWFLRVFSPWFHFHKPLYIHSTPGSQMDGSGQMMEKWLQDQMGHLAMVFCCHGPMKTCCVDMCSCESSPDFRSWVSDTKMPLDRWTVLLARRIPSGRGSWSSLCVNSEAQQLAGAGCWCTARLPWMWDGERVAELFNSFITQMTQMS